MNVKEWLGESNTLGIDIWNKKYRYNNESFDEWLDRVSGHDEHIKKLIVEKKFLFGGRILAGRGIANTDDCKRSLSNCYVISPPEDNLESIFDTNKEIARTYSYGGGCGTDISKLAPSGAKVRNSAKESSGAVSFMDLYSLTTGLICQAGRRGALMISMDVNHPDIEKFITVKSDTDKVTKANISVKITDEFMEAVVRDEMFELYFKREETGEEIKKEVRAKDLFRLICEQAWDNAEPGVLFWDTITRYNLMEYDENFELAGTNPCVSGDTLLLTRKGYFPIKSLVGKEVEVWNGKEFTLSTPRITGYNQPMLRIKTSVGCEIECTTYHKFILPNGDRIEANKLKEGMILAKPDVFPIIEGVSNPYVYLKENEYPSVTSIEKIDNADVVYCLTEKGNHSVIFNGIYTGQCGELPLPAGGTCLLGSINLSAFVKDDKTFDFEEFESAVFTTVHALDTVLGEGIELHPLKIQRESAENWRPIGLGIMGLADMLIKMEIVYGSQESLDLCDKIGFTMARCAISQSVEDAEQRGDFPNCDRCDIVMSEFFKKHAHPTDGSKVLEDGIRNSQLLTIPPTGSIATMLNISTGIEPIFDKFYTRKTETLNNEEKYYKIYTQIVWDYMQEHGLSEDEDDKLPEWFVTAKEIDYKDRIKMQSVWQSHIDNSISSTVNLPNSATVEDVMDLYMRAWKSGCKGTTIFREGCKRTPILDSGKNDKDQMINDDKNRDDLLSIAIKKVNYILNQEVSNIKIRNYILQKIDEIISKYKTEKLAEFVDDITRGEIPVILKEYIVATSDDAIYERSTNLAKLFRLQNGEGEKKDIPYYEQTGSTIKDFYDDIMENTATEITRREAAKRKFKTFSDKVLDGKVKDVSIKDILDSWNGECPKIKTQIIDRTPIKGKNEFTTELTAKEGNTLERGEVIKAPANSIGKNRDLITGCGSLHFQAFFDMTTGDVVMTYLSKGSKGGCNSFMVGLSRLISMAGRAGINVYEIVDQLHSVPGCTSYVGRKREKKDTSKGTCCPGAVGYALIEMYEEVQEEIALGGVYKGSPLYYRLKEERDANKAMKKSIPQLDWDIIDRLYKEAHELVNESENNELITPQTSKLADTLLAIPGVGEVLSNMSDEDLKKALDSIYKATYDDEYVEDDEREFGDMIAVDVDDIDNSQPEKIEPLTEEKQRELMAKLYSVDLIQDMFTASAKAIKNEDMTNEKYARLIEALKKNPGMLDVLAYNMRHREINSLDDLFNQVDHGLKPVGMGKPGVIFQDMQDDLKGKYASDVGLCPECGAPLAFEGGCNTCKSCGWSKCD